MKKVCCTLFVIVAVLMYIGATADEIKTSGLYTYSIKGNGTITITGYDWANSSGDIYIPSMIDGYTVTGIGDEAFTNNPLSHSTLLGEVYIRLPETIISIGNRAFFDSGIIGINIPNSVQYIGEAAFAYCPIKQFAVEPNHTVYSSIDGALYHKGNKELLAYPFAHENIIIPEGIISIASYAMCGHGSIGLDPYSVAKQKDTTRMIGYSFRGGENIEIDKLPSTIRSIGKYAFADSVIVSSTSEYQILPNGVTKIEEGAFNNCIFKLNGSKPIVHFPTSIDSIGKFAFSNSSFTTGAWDIQFDIQSESIDVEDYAFSGLNFFTASSLSIKKLRIRNIGSHVFDGGDNHFEIWLDIKQAKSISEYAFESDCTLAGVWNEWPGTVTTIQEGVYNNTPISDLTISEGVKEIADRAFMGAYKLQSVILPSTLETIGESAFSDCTNLRKIHIPESVREIRLNGFNRQTTTLVVNQSSYAALWAQENGYNYQYADEQATNVDWLNN